MSRSPPAILPTEAAPHPPQMLPRGKTPLSPLSWSLLQNVSSSLQSTSAALSFPFPWAELHPLPCRLFPLVSSPKPSALQWSKESSDCTEVGRARTLMGQSLIMYLAFLHKQSDSPNCPLNQPREETFFNLLSLFKQRKTWPSVIRNQREREIRVH